MVLFGVKETHDLSKYEGSVCARPAADWNRPLGKSPVQPSPVAPMTSSPSACSPHGPPPPIPPRPTNTHGSRYSAPSVCAAAPPTSNIDPPHHGRSTSAFASSRVRALPPPPICPPVINPLAGVGSPQSSHGGIAPAWLPQYTPLPQPEGFLPTPPPPLRYPPRPPSFGHKQLTPRATSYPAGFPPGPAWDASNGSDYARPVNMPLPIPATASTAPRNGGTVASAPLPSPSVPINPAAGNLATINGQDLDEDEALRLAIAQSLNLEQEKQLSERFWQQWHDETGGDQATRPVVSPVSAVPTFRDRDGRPLAHEVNRAPGLQSVASFAGATSQSPAFSQPASAASSPGPPQRESPALGSSNRLEEATVSMPRPHPAIRRSSTSSARSIKSEAPSEIQRSVRPPSIGGRTLSSISSVDDDRIPEESPGLQEDEGTIGGTDDEGEDEPGTSYGDTIDAGRFAMSESLIHTALVLLGTDAIFTACCYDKPGLPLSRDMILTIVPSTISLPPQPSTFQMISTSFQDILREIVAQRDSRIEPSPTAFDAFRSSHDLKFQLIITFRFVELRSAAPSRKFNKHFETRRGREKLSRYIPGGAFRTILVLELDEWKNASPVAAPPSTDKQGITPLSHRHRGSQGTPAVESAAACSLIRNPLLPSDQVTETLVLRFAQPISLPCTNEYLVERLHAHLKLGKQARPSSSRSPDPGIVEENAAIFSKLVEQYPGPISKDAELSRAHKLDKAEDFVSGHAVERRRRNPIRRVTSKVIGAVQHSRPETVEDERESWITPFKVD